MKKFFLLIAICSLFVITSCSNKVHKADLEENETDENDADTTDIEPSDTDPNSDAEPTDAEPNDSEPVNNDSDTTPPEETEFPECGETIIFPCKDSTSNMIWSEKSPTGRHWGDAISFCDDFNTQNYGGFTNGWRLPSVSELRTLIQNCSGTEVGGSCAVKDPDCLLIACWSDDCYCTDEPENGYSKLGDNDWLWSSSIPSDNPEKVWFVNFHGGSIEYGDPDDDENSVRCVRSE